MLVKTNLFKCSYSCGKGLNKTQLVWVNMLEVKDKLNNNVRINFFMSNNYFIKSILFVSEYPSVIIL